MTLTTTFILYMVVNIVALYFMYRADRQRTCTPCRSGLLVIRGRQIYLGCSLIVLFLFSALRDHVGIDYAAYVQIYSDIGTDNLFEAERQWMMANPIYFYLNRILYFISDSYILLFAVIAFLTLFFFYEAIEKLSINWTFSLYLMLCFNFYYQSFNQIREMLAVAIVAFSFYYLTKNKIRWFLFWVFVAAGFHPSALIILLVYPFRNIKLSVRTLIFYFAIGLVMVIAFEEIVSSFSFLTAVQNYSGDEQGAAAAFQMSTVVNFFVRVAILAFCLSLYRQTVRRASYTRVLYNIAVLCTIGQVAAMMFAIMGRLTTYFFVTYLFLLPEVMKSLNLYFTKGSKKIVASAAYIGFFVYFLGYTFLPFVISDDAIELQIYQTWLSFF